MTTLIEAIKNLRHSQKVLKAFVAEDVEFDLSRDFIGEPMTAPVLKRLSQYIDYKLIEYSSKRGTLPATMPSSRDLPDSEDGRSFSRLPQKLSNINPAAINALAEAIDEAVEEVIEDEHICHSPIKDVFIRTPNNTKFIRPHSIGVHCVDGDPLTRQGGSKYVRTPPVGLSWPEDDDISEEENTESYDERITAMNEHDVEPEEPTNGVTDYRPVRHVDEIVTYRPMPGVFLEQREEHSYSSGCLPTVTQRDRDVICRFPQDPPNNRAVLVSDQDLKIRKQFPNNSFEFGRFIPAIGSDVSYVTSYDIDNRTQRIKARIITAPNTVVISHEDWFNLCYFRESEGPNQTISDIIKANLCIINKTRAEPIALKDIGAPEQTALETLREMITEREFRHYLRYGFIAVRGNSGRIYQIHRKQSHTKVWLDGKLKEEICVRIKDIQVPPTDNVIAFKVMIETCEDTFRSSGNIYKVA